MKKFFILGTALMGMMLMAGCATPKNINVSGKWDYRYDDEKKTGSMELQQMGTKLTGVSNDAEGEFQLTGTVNSDVIVLAGTNAKKKASYNLNAKLTSEDEFSGTYTTSSGKSGKLSATRK